MTTLAIRPAQETPLDIVAYGIRRSGDTDARAPDPAQVATAQAYLRTLPRAEKGHSSRWPGSYGLKHLAERWGAERGMQSYVSNGALILAARNLGIPLRVAPLGPNALVAVQLGD